MICTITEGTLTFSSGVSGGSAAPEAATPTKAPAECLRDALDRIPEDVLEGLYEKARTTRFSPRAMREFNATYESESWHPALDAHARFLRCLHLAVTEGER